MTTRQTIKKFFEPATILRTLTLKAVVFSILRTSYNLSSVVLVQKIIEKVQAGDMAGIQYRLIVYGAIFLLMLVYFNLAYDRWRWKQLHEYDKYIQEKYLNIILLMESNEFEKVGTGKFIGNLRSGSENRSDCLTGLSYNIPAFVVSLLFSLYLAFQISATFLRWYIGIILALGVFVVIINSKWLGYRRHMAETKLDLVRHMAKILMSKFEIIISGKLSEEIRKNNNFNDSLRDDNTKLSYYTFFTHEGPRAFLNLSKILLICLVVYGSSLAGIALPQIIGFIVVLSYVDDSLQSFAHSYKNVTKQINVIEKLREYENYPSVGDSYLKGHELRTTAWSISLSHVSYSYTKNSPILSDFSLDLQGSKKTALVWPSWGGKSTLVKLIAWYLVADAWEIMIDNQKLSEVSLISYYKHIWYLTQEPSVFDGTIRENLEYPMGEIKLTDEQLNEIIALSKCERIYDLPKGLGTEIGERGIRLSWGQKQRLAIAKIMLKNPDIILLDEPTSALDSYNEEQITQALNNLFKDKTVIVIAHRLQTVKNADEIIYLWQAEKAESTKKDQKGQFVGAVVMERGSHEELLALKGEYYKMVELQSGF